MPSKPMKNPSQPPVTDGHDVRLHAGEEDADVEAVRSLGQDHVIADAEAVGGVQARTRRRGT